MGQVTERPDPQQKQTQSREPKDPARRGWVFQADSRRGRAEDKEEDALRAVIAIEKQAEGIIADAEAEAKRIFADAQARADDMLAQAMTQAQAESEEAIKKAWHACQDEARSIQEKADQDAAQWSLRAEHYLDEVIAFVVGSVILEGNGRDGTRS